MENDTLEYQFHSLGILSDYTRNGNVKFFFPFLLCETFLGTVQDFRVRLLSVPGGMQFLFLKCRKEFPSL